MGAGWVINVAIAEWIIRRRREPRLVSEGPAARELVAAQSG
jgi:hypothetical protein